MNRLFSFRPSHRALLAAVICAQVCCILYGFWPYFQRPGTFSLQPIWDGAHSYHGFFARLQQGTDHSIWKHDMQGYPFGDYPFHQGNAIAFTVPIMLVSRYLVDLNPYALPLYNGLHLFSILLVTLSLYVVLRRFIKTWWFLALLCLALPWISPQFLRLDAGHFPLAHAWVLLGGLYLLLRIVETEGKRNRLFVALGFWVMFTALCHFYSLFLLALLIVLPLAVHAGMAWIKSGQKNGLISGLKDAFALRFGPFMMLAKTLASIGIGALLVVVSMRMIDDWSGLRSPVSPGYDWENWGLDLGALFKPYGFTRTTPFPLQYKGETFYEGDSYLGGFFLYGLSAIALLSVFRRSAYLSMRGLTQKSACPALVAGLGITALLALSMSIGEHFTIGGHSYENYIHPFRILGRIAPLFTQFRCLARFSWVFWWIALLGFAAWVDAYIREGKFRYLRIVAACLPIFLFTDMFDTMAFARNLDQTDLILSPALRKEYQTVVDTLPIGEYQAILPLPYFNIGSDRLSHTTDGAERHNADMFRLSLYTHLPLMAVQNARCVEPHTTALCDAFSKNGIPKEVASRLDAKPILVVKNKYLFEGDQVVSSCLPGADKHPAHDVAAFGHHLIDWYQMRLLGEDARHVHYRWEWQTPIRLDPARLQLRGAAAEARAEMVRGKKALIRSTPDWLAEVAKKATEQHVSLDTMIARDARWVLDHP